MGTILFLVIAFLFGTYAIHKNSGCLLTIFVVVFFLGGICALNGEGIHPAISFLLIAAVSVGSGFAAAKLEDYSAIKSEHSNDRDESASGSGFGEDAPEVNEIVDEAVMVVNDMVYAAYSLHYLLLFSERNDSEEFRGKIFIHISDARPVGSKIDISLQETRDLCKVLDDFDEGRKQGKIHEKYEDEVYKARLFTYKYGKYCVQKENGDHEIRYSVVNPHFELSSRNNSTAKLFALIKTAIRERCDGVECSDSGGLFIVYIKSVKEIWDDM